MIKKPFLVLTLLFVCGIAQAQDRYFTKTGKIEFYSKAPMEDIEARNKTVAVVLDTKSGLLQFSVLMKSFEFEKALMQEHFNENYVESDKFPKAEFKGTVVNNSTVIYGADGSYPVTIKGKLTMHGVSRDIETSGILKVTGDKIEATSIFNVLLSDYGVSIPAVVKEKISNSIQITVNTKLEPLK